MSSTPAGTRAARSRTHYAWTMSDRLRPLAAQLIVTVVAGIATAAVLTPQSHAYTIHSFTRPSAAFRFLSRTHLRPAPQWPGYLSPRIRLGHLWNVVNVAGADAPDPTLDGLAYGATAYRVDFGYTVTQSDFSGFGGGSFARTDPKALARLIRAFRKGYTPRHLRLGGHRVTEFRPGSTSTC